MTNGADGCTRGDWERVARWVATVVQDALRCWMVREVEHWRVCRVAADHRSALRTGGRREL